MLDKSVIQHGKVVIVDSGFCVLQGLIELRKVGIFASAVIEKENLDRTFVLEKQLINTWKIKSYISLTG